MRKLLCWLFDHDRMTTSARHRICLRCGQRETLRHFGRVLAWEEVAEAHPSRSLRVTRSPADSSPRSAAVNRR